ncbi:vacuolar ATPase assembly integral membrane protein VMA21 homolog [Bacillus rossius redtenbacheri]|uniref:vacuolar ATPase assembly integral membrane protein VMA21 homolog n=1 Tax=Bacillus rossius redtenbacheri TaxID=93214 RepID=UPI002FDDA465
MSGKEVLDQRDLSVFTNVFFYCFNIIALPVASFFLSKTLVFDGLLQLTQTKSSVCSAVTAVVALHLALGLYIYKAYSGPDKPPSKRD